METTVEVIAVVSTTVAIILAIVAGLKSWECKNVEQRCKELYQDNDTALEWVSEKQKKIIDLEADLKAASDRRDEWHNKYLDVRGELEGVTDKAFHLQSHVNDLDKIIANLQATIQDQKQTIQGQFESRRGLTNKYTDLIAMPRRKRDKLIAELRKEMGVKVARVVRVKEGLVRGLTVKNPTEDEAIEIFAKAKELDIVVHDFEQMPNDDYPWVWYVGDGICRCAGRAGNNDTYVTASEFMQRMRNHVGK